MVRVCTNCRVLMRIVALIEDQLVVRAILENLSLWDAPRPRPPPLADVGPADFVYVLCEN